MLSEVAWILPGRILCVQFSDIVTRSEIQQMNQMCVSLLTQDGISPGIHIIIDVSHVRRYENDVLRIELLKDLVQRHPLVDWVIIVNPVPNAIVRFVGMSLISLMKFRYHMTRTREDAIAFIMPRLPQYEAL